MNNQNQIIGNNIMNQMGGINRLDAMVGLKDVFLVENGIRFKIKVRGAKANYVKIVLNSMDLYDIEFGNVRGVNYTVVAKREGIYDDMLKSVVSKETGLALSL